MAGNGLRQFIFMASLAWLGSASATEGDWPAWPRAWTVNLSGEWTITGCPLDARTVRVVQDGQVLRTPPDTGNGPILRGTVHGHDVDFTIDHGDALNCLPASAPLRFTGRAAGARIMGMLASSSDPSITTAISIHLHREFMLSFDDGPLPGRTDRVLDSLQRLHASDGLPVRAAFFTVDTANAAAHTWYAPYEIWRTKGDMRSHPDLIARILRDGHVLGNHTAHHAWFRWPRFQDPREVIIELRAWEAAAPPNLAQEKLLRPAYLVTTDAVLSAAKDTHYSIVLGSTVGDTLPGSNVDAIEWKILSTLETHDATSPVLLIFHDSLSVTASHLEEIIKRLQDAGYALSHFDTKRLDATTLIRPH